MAGHPWHRRPRVVAAVLAAVTLGAVALVLFEPWRVWTSSTVDEAAPPLAAPSAAPTVPPGAGAGAAEGGAPGVLGTGTFVSHEHATRGRARLLRLADGTHVLRLEGLDTSDGPALRVWLSDQPVTPDGWRVFDDGEHVDLGELKATRGNQNYAVPGGVDLDRLTSVSVWCARFRVSFGAAALSPAGG